MHSRIAKLPRLKIQLQHCQQRTTKTKPTTNSKLQLRTTSFLLLSILLVNIHTPTTIMSFSIGTSGTESAPVQKMDMALGT